MRAQADKFKAAFADFFRAQGHEAKPDEISALASLATGDLTAALDKAGEAVGIIDQDALAALESVGRKVLDTVKDRRGRPKGKGKRRNRNLTSPALIAARQRALEACEYRKMGYTYARIAEFCGYNSEQAAHVAVRRILDRQREQVGESLLAVLIGRLELVITGAMQPAMAGDAFAAETILKVHDRYAKLFGLDKPTKIAPTTPDGTEALPGLNWADVIAAAELAKRFDA